MEQEEFEELMEKRLDKARLSGHQSTLSRIKHELTVLKVEFRNSPTNDLELFEAATIAQESVGDLLDIVVEKAVKL